MELLDRIRERHEALTAWRHHIHSHPELAYEEKVTSDFVAEKLAGFGLEVHRGLGVTGVVGTLRAGNSDRAIGLRADMDALPIQELNEFEHRSRHEGLMHACGHDGHTTMLLGAAEHLAANPDFDGVVHFIFQPAEEGRAGAKAMIDDGLFDLFPVDAPPDHRPGGDRRPHHHGAAVAGQPQRGAHRLRGGVGHRAAGRRDLQRHP
jgi:hippurate hydrolase